MLLAAACGPDGPRVFPVVRLAAERREPAGDPATASAPAGTVNGVRRVVLERPTQPSGWTTLILRVVPRLPAGPIPVDVPIPEGLRGAPLRVQALLSPITRPVPESVRSRAVLGLDDLRRVMSAGLGPPTGALRFEPSVVRAPGTHATFTLTTAGPADGGDAMLTVRGRPEPEHRYETDPLTIPARARLRFALGVERSAGDTRVAARFGLAALVDGREEPLLQTRLDPAPAAWEDHEVDLAAYGGNTVRLRFTSAVEAADEGPLPIPLWGDPTIVTDGPPSGAAPRWNVLLVSLDTLRADHLGCYGYGRPTSPRIDAELAARGTVFTRAYASFPSTAGSHATILTSLDPCVHGFVNANPPPPLRPDAYTLGELLRAQGYETAAFTEDGWVLATLGFARGFGTYVERTGTLADLPSGEAAGTFGDALAWIERHRDLPWFVFAHTYQVHHPHTPPPGYLERVVEPRDASPSEADRYNAEIRYTDDLLGGLLEGLDRLGLARRTLVVLLSDHGEQFGEHGLHRHGTSLFDTLLRVVLIVRAPRVAPAGERIDAPVGLIDVVPTILDLLGLAPAPWVQGRSLAPLLRGEALPPRTLFAEVAKHRDAVRAQMAARVGDLKWIIDLESGRGRAFDLRDDPGEDHDISDRLPPDASARVLAEFRRHCAALPPTRPGAAPALDPAVRAKLRALGYLE